MLDNLVSEAGEDELNVLPSMLAIEHPFQNVAALDKPEQVGSALILKSQVTSASSDHTALVICRHSSSLKRSCSPRRRSGFCPKRGQLFRQTCLSQRYPLRNTQFTPLAAVAVDLVCASIM